MPDKTEYRISLKETKENGTSYHWITPKLEIILIRNRSKLKAYQSICPHMGGQLALDSRGRALSCPWHGLKFDLETGCSGHARHPSIRRFHAEVRGEEVVLWEAPCP